MAFYGFFRVDVVLGLQSEDQLIMLGNTIFTKFQKEAPRNMPLILILSFVLSFFIWKTFYKEKVFFTSNQNTGKPDVKFILAGGLVLVLLYLQSFRTYSTHRFSTETEVLPRVVTCVNVDRGFVRLTGSSEGYYNPFSDQGVQVLDDAFELEIEEEKKILKSFMDPLFMEENGANNGVIPPNDPGEPSGGAPSGNGGAPPPGSDGNAPPPPRGNGGAPPTGSPGNPRGSGGVPPTGSQGTTQKGQRGRGITARQGVSNSSVNTNPLSFTEEEVDSPRRRRVRPRTGLVTNPGEAGRAFFPRPVTPPRRVRPSTSLGTNPPRAERRPALGVGPETRAALGGGAGMRFALHLLAHGDLYLAPHPKNFPGYGYGPPVNLPGNVVPHPVNFPENVYAPPGNLPENVYAPPGNLPGNVVPHPGNPQSGNFPTAGSTPSSNP